MNRIEAACVLAVVALATVPRASRAWDIGTAVSDPCHETASSEALHRAIQRGGFAVAERVPLPDSGSWKHIYDRIDHGAGLGFLTDEEQFVALSLVLGARYPDTGGDSVSDVSSMHTLHDDPAKQMAHCLRRPEDDGPEGDFHALENCLDNIRGKLYQALNSYLYAAQDQITSTEVTVDFYGKVRIQVWNPAFEIGVALHAFEDSFSHTVRSDDLAKVRQVMNAVDAKRESFDPDRDGISHSFVMDQCEGDAAPIFDVMKIAAADMLVAASAYLTSRDDKPIDELFDKWMSYEPGCTRNNDFCGSKWSELAQDDRTYELCQAAPLGGAGEFRGAVPILALFASILTLVLVRCRRTLSGLVLARLRRLRKL